MGIVMEEKELLEEMGDDPLEQEFPIEVEMPPKSVTPVTIIKKKHGLVPLRHKHVAFMAARSFPVDIIAQQTGMREATIRRLIEENQDVWEEIQAELGRMYEEGDRILVLLRKKALTKLDEQLESRDPEIVEKAIDKILKVTDYAQPKEGDRTAIFIGAGGKSVQGIESIDDMIIRMRQERGLETPKELLAPTVSPGGLPEKIESDEEDVEVEEP